MLNDLSIRLLGPQATDSFGLQFASCVSAPLRIYLSGPLGAGKTSLVRALLRGLGVVGSIKSPSYALVEPYTLSSYSVYHFDFYRFFDENEWIESGFRDFFVSDDAICLVEWPEKANELLPVPDLMIQLSYPANEAGGGFDSERQLWLSAHSERGELVVQTLKTKESLGDYGPTS